MFGRIYAGSSVFDVSIKYNAKKVAPKDNAEAIITVPAFTDFCPLNLEANTKEAKPTATPEVIANTVCAEVGYNHFAIN